MIMNSDSDSAPSLNTWHSDLVLRLSTQPHGTGSALSTELPQFSIQTQCKGVLSIKNHNLGSVHIDTSTLVVQLEFLASAKY